MVRINELDERSLRLLHNRLRQLEHSVALMRDRVASFTRPQQPGPQFYLGKLTAELEQGGVATMDVWSGPPGEEAATALEIEVGDWLLATGQTIASGKKVIARRINDTYYVIAAECA